MFVSKSLLRFGVGLITSLIAMTCLFAYLSPHYNSLIVRASNGLIGLLEHPRRTVLEAQGSRALVLKRSPEEETPLLRYNYEQYYGVILFLSLLLATPRLGFTRKLVSAMVGLCALVVFHTLVLAANARIDIHGESWLTTLFLFTRVAVVVLLWVLLTFRYWFPWPKAAPLKGEHPKPNDPCPCGSGKKYKYCCGRRGR